MINRIAEKKEESSYKNLFSSDPKCYALIHRDYTNTSNLKIKVYNDKLVMYNGALLSNEIHIEKFDKQGQSKPFNPFISSVFYEVGFIEKGGKGTLNIIAERLVYGLPKPTYEYEWTAVGTTFYKAKTNVGTNEVFEFIKQHQPTKANVIGQSFNVTQRTIERYIKQLKDSAKIEFKGSSKMEGYICGYSRIMKEHLNRLKIDSIIKRIDNTKTGYWEVDLQVLKYYLEKFNTQRIIVWYITSKYDFS